MQTTGHTSTQELSFVPMQGSLITYAKGDLPDEYFHNWSVRKTITPGGRDVIFYTRELLKKDGHDGTACQDAPHPGRPAHTAGDRGTTAATAATARRDATRAR
jgi:hypothetical protein